jgi:nitric oxide reductase large subunit
VSLLEQEDGAPVDQLSTGSTVAGHRSQRTSHGDALAVAPLHQEKTSKIIAGWPSSPKSTVTPTYVKVLNGVFDVILLACSVAFLAFVVVVNVHDQDSTADHPRLTTTLLRATKYVLSLEIFLKDIC